MTVQYETYDPADDTSFWAVVAAFMQAKDNPHSVERALVDWWALPWYKRAFYWAASTW